jgi:hypothetical protein
MALGRKVNKKNTGNYKGNRQYLSHVDKQSLFKTNLWFFDEFNDESHAEDQDHKKSE